MEMMLMDFDSDDEKRADDGDVHRGHELKQRRERERLHAQLKALLARLERPSGMPVHKAAAMAKKGAVW